MPGALASSDAFLAAPPLQIFSVAAHPPARFGGAGGTSGPAYGDGFPGARGNIGI